MSISKLESIVFLCLFCLYGWLASKIPLDFWSEDELFNARSLPYAITAGGVLVTLLMFIQPSNKTSVADTVGDTWNRLKPLDWLPVILLFVSMSLYSMVLEYLGFIVTTISFLIVSYLILGERQPKRLLLASVPLVIAFWLLMDFLGIYLSPGELFSHA